MPDRPTDRPLEPGAISPQTRAAVDATIRALAGPGARARDDQLLAVAALADDHRRALVVQATGWGKSAVYWAATRARRDQGAGVTLVVSPLLALMRDQVAAAERAGLVAATVNSSNIDDWDGVFEALRRNELDVLLVSPERLANPGFARRLEALSASVGLLVIDEAHCISDWGHDFRPDYQRVAGVLLRLADATPVLATTATANERVTADVAAQLGEHTFVLRGPLARTSLRLSVTGSMGALDRYAWVADAVGKLDGSGIVYVLTVAETERLAGFLRGRGLDVVAYSSQVDPDDRARIEAELLANRRKAVVATSALGMGFDKPDLGFVIHVGSPPSPVSYYQQVGRAGRALDQAHAILLPSAADAGVWEYFATASIPNEDDAHRVLASLRANGGMSLPSIEAETGLRRGRLEALLKTLAVDGAVTKDGTAWVATDADWAYDHTKYDALRQVRRHEAELMRDYARGAGCLMQFLQLALDDTDPQPCGRCSVCTGELPFPGPTASAATRQAAREFLRGRDVVLEQRKLWPSGTVGRKGRIAGATEGRAVAFADDPGWEDELAALTEGALYPDALLTAAVEAVTRWGIVVDAVVPMPAPAGARPRVAQLATALATALGVSTTELLRSTGSPADREAASGVKVAGLLASLQRVEPAAGVPMPARVLLVDDRWRTGWTMTVAAALLRDAGTDAVHPFVVHKQP